MPAATLGVIFIRAKYPAIEGVNPATLVTFQEREPRQDLTELGVQA
jgi:hypothetical protein